MRKRNLSFLLAFVGGLTIVLPGLHCQAPAGPEPFVLDLPEGFPEPEFPEGNELTHERVELGRMLFHDPSLSRDSSLSCASCHLSSLAFTDGKPISTGIAGRLGNRNTPSLFNVAYHPYFFAEGGSPSLEMQSHGPIETEHEMDFNLREAADRLKGNPRYVELANLAYGRPMDTYVLTRAIASFERTLYSGNADYDAYQRGDASALSPEAQRGMQLFFSEKANCSSCHSGFNFTDYGFYNIGLYAKDNEDLGRYRITLDSADISRFKTPSLRNVALTAPYMHDGSLKTLERVVAHFNQGGNGHYNQDSRLKPLNLTESEQQDLVAFLESLTEREQ